VAVELVSPKNGDTALDVCSGTGDFLSILRDKVGVEGAACGIDFCSPMLECAAEKGIDKLAQGDAVQLPVQDGVADVVTVGWGIRNVPDIDLAHQEIARVLKSGGRFVSVDMAVPRNPLIRLASRFIAKRVLPLIGNMFGARQAYTYLPESTERFLDRDELAHSMRKAGFVHVQYRDFMLGNICLHTGTKP
jgi:demethylmenaquinone methyltransferase/2-methoxy-6-polyprenyl-1,4-benzoquinol methylase